MSKSYVGTTMTNRSAVDRRALLTGAATIYAAGLTGAGNAWAQQPVVQSGSAVWREFVRLASEAQRLGLAAPRVSATLDAGTEFQQIMPALVDLIDGMEVSASLSTAPAADVRRLVDETADLLQRVTSAERSPHTDRDPGTGAAVSPGRPTFEALKDGYLRLFETCRIREQHQTSIAWYVSKLVDPANRAQYLRVEAEACVPWYFIGIIHGLECSFNFRAHLHNGDPLKARTVQIPRNRPATWNPPTDWISSAKDSLAYEGFVDLEDWSLARMMYRWEAYNGFRSRANGINTPYLWSFSNHYTRGKFVADNVWDANAVSKQCGAAVMLKALLERGAVTLPA